MANDSLLAELCEAYGVLTDYEDVFKNRHRVPVASLRNILSAMGVDVASSADMKMALKQRKAEQKARLLPPVLVHRQTQGDCQVKINAKKAISVAWSLALESGRIIKGERSGGKSGLTLAGPIELGYHRLTVAAADIPPVTMSLICVPDDCFVPPALQGNGRVWGLAVQLYAIRSSRNWGIGDFTDLRNLVELSAQFGANIIGVNPLHALYPDIPEQVSPYCPSSRSFLNTLYIDVEAVPEFSECDEACRLVNSPDFQVHLRALRSDAFVNYPAVHALKQQILKILHRHFLNRHVGSNSCRAQSFQQFLDDRGVSLRRQGLYEALQEHFHRQDPMLWGWPVWPSVYHDPNSPEVEAFAQNNQERIGFFQYLQWLSEEQLAAIGRKSSELGLGLGLYQDIAVGTDIGGCEVWNDRHLYATGIKVGCPPDEFNRKGQDWGLPPWNPHSLQEAAYAPFITMLRENMRHCGAVRLDHVMGLMRLFWIPSKGQPGEGGYVLYPLDDLLGILALESQRNRCLVVGEDLGTVPKSLQGELGKRHIYSYRVLMLERDKDGSFLGPAVYPEQALAAATTHDLPTLQGFWKGHDLDIRTDLDLFPDEKTREQMITRRAQDRAQLLLALDKEGLLPDEASVHPVSVSEMGPGMVAALYRFLSKSPSKILMIQPEDIFGQIDQANMPGTVDEHPNWRRKLSLDIEAWNDDSQRSFLFHTLSEERKPFKGSPEQTGKTCGSVDIPRATYRLQLNGTFTFADAESAIPYLQELGVSHLYLSPCLKARPGSVHGYDIIDHEVINPELGGAEGFQNLATAAKAHGMGIILDIVPNHMGVLAGDNGWWLDVLENGPASPYATYFDIDWDPVDVNMKGRVLLPILGEHYGRVLEDGQLELLFDPAIGDFHIQYYEHRLPIDPREYPRILGHRLDVLVTRLGHGNPLLDEFQSLSSAFGRLPTRLSAPETEKSERVRDRVIYKRNLAGLCANSPDIAAFVAENVAEFNGRKGDPESFDLLHKLLNAQAYRLSHWRIAADDINYRRFFDINDLAGLCMERPEVFEAAHRLVFRLLAEGSICGLRIDHPDGLFDPKEYFIRLQKSNGENGFVYLVAEKILEPDEALPSDWPIHGTTGYDFGNLLNGLFVNMSAESKMGRTYEAFTGRQADFEEIVYKCKKLIMHSALASELNVLANKLSRIAQSDRMTCDYSLNGLRDALIEIVAAFPVYRTYIANGACSEADLRYIDSAISKAKRRDHTDDLSIYDFVRNVLTTECCPGKSDDYGEAVRAFAMRFQQLTSPVMAKSVEDTAFYRYNRLVSLNEVGADPKQFGISVKKFHATNRKRQMDWPHAMLSTSTHDSKRSEDVRARINVLSEIPDAWRQSVRRWSKINQKHKLFVGNVMAPSRNDEYLLYQTLLGVFPRGPSSPELGNDFRIRIQNYMIKTAREAKVNTSWINPNQDYEAALEAFIAGLLMPGPDNLFLNDFLQFQLQLSKMGAISGLSQQLLKLTAPGVPDIYQGNECWQFRLVDPDNRQKIDFSGHQARLQALKGRLAGGDHSRVSLCAQLVDNIEDDDAKLFVTWSVLDLRREDPELFCEGRYVPLPVSGARRDDMIAYARVTSRSCVLVAAPIRAAGLYLISSGTSSKTDIWDDTRIVIPARLRACLFMDIFTGRTFEVSKDRKAGFLPASDLFQNFPVTLLKGEFR